MWFLIGKKSKRFDSINIMPIFLMVLILTMIQIFFYTQTKPVEYKYEVKALKKLSYDISKIKDYPALVVITINKEKQLFINDQPTDMEKLTSDIKNILSITSVDKRVVYLRAAKDLSYGAIIAVIDRLKSENITNISLQIDYIDDL